jgi:hypothetical protein
MTPFKGSMLGGTVLGEGEESAMVGTIGAEKGGQTQVKYAFIYLSEIDKVYKVGNCFIIIKKN